MELSKVMNGVNVIKSYGDLGVDITDIAYDSRKAQKGGAFVCLRGADVDGHDYINSAIKNGASVIISEKDINLEGVTVLMVENTRKVLALISANFFNHPAKELTTIGITGTKGKTTTACMIKSIIEKSGSKVGMIGTLGVVIGDKILKTNNTTPESYEIQKNMREMINSGCKSVVMEVSSIGLRDHRVDGFEFDYGIFTNFSEDHIGGNEHKSLEEYLQCKRELFRKCKVGIINKDDAKFDAVLEGHRCRQIKTFGFDEGADLRADDICLVSEPGYIGVKFRVSGDANMQIRVPIPGKFSVYNAMAARELSKCMDIEDKFIAVGLDNARVKGRVEPVNVEGNYTLLIDYAHNALSMENVLKTLKQYDHNRLITLFGAGGNRSKVRRYEMGEVSGKLSDLSVVTEDNSRYEDVMDIIEDIKIGLNKVNGKYIVIPDRKKAIRYCIENAQDKDIIVLAGKGHEDYQEIKGVRYPFDEREVIKDIISEMKNEMKI